MVELVDTHCHIQSAGSKAGERGTRELWAKAPELDADIIIEQANSVQVTKLICVGCDLADSQLAVEFVQNRLGCWASIGIHPHEAKDYVNQSDKLNKLAELANKPKVISVGECGLDYYYQHSPILDQEKVLRFQIEVALSHDLPIIFHVRDAFDDFWKITGDYDNLRGVLHSYTDNRANLDKALAKGYMIGVNGIATFTKDQAQLEVYKSIPIDRLLLETDAPFLTPKPYRGQINQPKHIAAIAEFLAELRNESFEQVASNTTKNAISLFGDSM